MEFRNIDKFKLAFLDQDKLSITSFHSVDDLYWSTLTLDSKDDQGWMFDDYEVTYNQPNISIRKNELLKKSLSAELNDENTKFEFEIEKDPLEDEHEGVDEFLESVNNTINKVKRSFKSKHECLIDKKFNLLNQEGNPLNKNGDILWLADWVTQRCLNCGAAFNFFNRKHHCRLCGKIFCGKCSSRRVLLRGRKVRTCINCYAIEVVDQKITLNMTF